MARDAEIEQIKRQLAILQARYSLYRQVAGILRGAFMILTAVLAIGALAFAINLFLFDALYGAFFVAAALLFTLVIVWFIRSSSLRWIDLASPYFRNIYSPYFFYPASKPRVKIRSGAEFVEQQIADRGRRLAELEESASPGPGG